MGVEIRHRQALLAAAADPCGITSTMAAEACGTGRGRCHIDMEKLVKLGELMRHVISERHIRYVLAGVQFQAPPPRPMNATEAAALARAKKQNAKSEAPRATYGRFKASAEVKGMDSARRTYGQPLPEGSRIGGFAPADTPQHHICARPGAFAFKAINSRGF
jgi:hypothetical protein